MHDALAHAPWERIMAMRALRSYGGGRPGLSRTISLISRVRPDRSLLYKSSMDPRESRRASEVRFRIRQKPKRMTKRKTEIQYRNGKQETLGIHAHKS
jgi:hypothetical protein